MGNCCPTENELVSSCSSISEKNKNIELQKQILTP